MKTGDATMRRVLAVGIVGASVAGIVIISAFAIALSSGGNNRAETSRLVFSSVLPLLGTWVGTVLAFYFARENLQAAADATIALAGTTTATPVTAVMVRAEQIVALDLPPGDDGSAIKLSELIARMTGMDPPARRLPVRDAAGAVLYVIHDSTLNAYAQDIEGHYQALPNKTLGDMLGLAKYRDLVTAIGFVPEKASVSEARGVMASIQNCNDVFVTPNGKRDERVVGWLTNTLLAGVQ